MDAYQSEDQVAGALVLVDPAPESERSRSARPASVQHVRIVEDIAPCFASSKEIRRLTMYVGLAFVDGLALLLAFAAASWLRFGGFSANGGGELLLVALPLLVATGAVTRAYSISALQAPRHSVKLGVRALLLTFAAIVGILFALKASTEFSRFVVGATALFAILFVALARTAYGHFVGRLYGWRFTNELLIVDDLVAPAGPGQQVIHAARAGITPCRDDPVMLDRLARLILYCDSVVIACSPGRRALWAAITKASGTNVELLMPELDALGPLALRRTECGAAVAVSHSPLGLRNRVLKRCLDLLVAVPALVLLAPLLALIALAIRLESRGPALFRQPRVGRSNRIFNVLKFRSMRIDRADRAGTRSAARDDERVTRIGRFLRRTSLDELPQLINVFRGEMSLVGPRPHALQSTAEDALFWEIDAKYWDRHCVKPGITGLAQVRGHRGATEMRSDLRARLQDDIEYLNGWSLARDILILIQTARVMMHRNAF